MQKANTVRELTKEQLQQQLEEALKRQKMVKQVSDCLQNALDQAAKLNGQQITLLKEQNASLIEQNRQQEQMLEQMRHRHTEQINRLRQQIFDKNRLLQSSAIQKDRIKVAFEDTIHQMEQQISFKEQKINQLEAKIHRLTMEKLDTEGQNFIKGSTVRQSFILGDLANSTLRYGEQNSNTINLSHLNSSKLPDKDDLRKQKLAYYSRMSKEEIKASVKAIKQAQKQMSRRETSHLCIPDRDFSRRINRTHFV